MLKRMDKAIYSMQMNQHTIVSINIVSWGGDCGSFASFVCVSACVACKCAAMWDSQNGFAEKCSMG
jgi:hypothetical protein